MLFQPAAPRASTGTVVLSTFIMGAELYQLSSVPQKALIQQQLPAWRIMYSATFSSGRPFGRDDVHRAFLLNHAGGHILGFTLHFNILPSPDNTTYILVWS
jgi:hypothetical protein